MREDRKEGVTTVPFIAYEAAAARADRTNKRLALLLAATVAINAAAVLLRRK